MQIRKTNIFLKNLTFFANHGVGEQEKKVGNVFYVDIKLKVNFTKALTTDDVSDTVNYAEIYQSIAHEMAIPSQLLEHVSGRIVRRLFMDFPPVEEIKIKIGKRNPPMGAEVESAGVEMHCLR
ncbi:MAG: dihydroneopterin aldolase [Bacteroides sp.]|nr:dihydroneopterin aldolase [Bacteroides sp.]